MAEAGQIIARGHPGSSECTSARDYQKGTRKYHSLFTVRSTRGSALSTAGYSSVTTAACLAPVSGVWTNCSTSGFQLSSRHVSPSIQEDAAAKVQELLVP
jgi:hypothetical protein